MRLGCMLSFFLLHWWSFLSNFCSLSKVIRFSICNRWTRGNTGECLLLRLLVLLAMYAYFISRVRLAQSSRPRITYAPMSAMDEERKANLNKIYNCNDVECVSMLRMRRAPFFNLCNLFRDRNLLRDTIHSSVEEQVVMFLHVVGHNQRFRVIHQNFRRSNETVSR